MPKREYIKRSDGKLAGSVSLGGKTPPNITSPPVYYPFNVEKGEEQSSSQLEISDIHAVYQRTHAMIGFNPDVKEVADMEQVKYPRTSHLPTSPGLTSDDRVISPEGFIRLQQLSDYIVTEKMDGGNITMTRNHFYGRSLDSGTHPWDTHAKRIWASIHYRIPPGYRISGESMYAQRSVPYDSLPDYYLVFGIWNEEGVLLPWDDTKRLAAEYELSLVPELYRGNDFTAAINAWRRSRTEDTSEGFVIRSADKITLDDFPDLVAKHVRADHVRTRADWRHRDDFATNTILLREEP